MLTNDLDLSSLHLGHLPLVRAITQRLGIDSVIDALSPMDPRSVVSDADCVAAMVMNILSGRCALYSMSEVFEHIDTDVVLGTGKPAEAFNDSRLAAALDHLYDVGTDNVLAGVVSKVLTLPDSPTAYSVFTDTTSIALQGVYDVEVEPGEPTPKRGYSKDHRPDLKQLVFGLSLHGALGTPMTCATLDGNASDKTANRWNIEALASQLPDHHDVTVVGDSKMVDAKLFGQLKDEGLHVVSLVPGTFKVRRDLLDLVRDKGVELAELARSPGRLKADPDSVYSGMSFRRPMEVQDPHTGDKTLHDMTLLVVHSDAQRRKFDTALTKRLVREEKAFMDAVNRANKLGIRCAEDAGKQRQKLLAKLNLQHTELVVEAHEVPEKRAKPGRPKKGEAAPTRTEYRLVYEQLKRDEDAIAKAAFDAAHFVLVTDHMDWSDARILEEYRSQSAIEGHGGFRWLKNVALVAPVFLKTPRRIAALGLVFVLALMVRNYLQFELRRRLKASNQKVGGRKRNTQTDTPTTETAMRHFMGVSCIRMCVGERILQRHTDRLSPDAQVILELLRVPVEAFSTPFEKWCPAFLETS